MKKLISLFLALVMVFSLAAPALAAEPTITGNTSGDVTANFNPNIEITGISVEGDTVTVTYDPETNTKTYTVVIPAGAESVNYTLVVEGTNLNYVPENDRNYEFGYPAVAEDGAPVADLKRVGEVSGYYNEETRKIEIELEFSSSQAGNTYSLNYTNDGWNSASENVQVECKQAYAISVADNIVGGSVYVGADHKKTSAVEGETVELFVEADGTHALKSLTVTYVDENNEPQNVYVDPEKHTFVMPAFAVTVNATFEAATTAYTITVDDTIVGGTVTVNDDLTSAHEGDDIILTVTPDEGYELVAVTVNDGSGSVTVHQVKDETNQYTFTMPAAAVTVTATFKAVYDISINVVGEGSVTADPSTAAEGETVTLTIAPDAGYVLYYLEVDYEQVAVNGNTYTFTMPEGPVYVRAIFERTGKALETLYVKNTGNWSTINVYFYTDSGLYSLDYANLTIVGSETDIYYTTAIPEFAYKVQFVYDGEFSEYINLPTDGILNQYNPDSNAWTEFVPTERPTISADIVWGSMSFTYTDENGWANNSTAEDAGTVTVTNTGASSISATVEYKQAEGYEAIHGYFDEESATASAELATTNASKTFTLTLSGKPEKAIPEGTKIGTVTVTIE